MREFYRKMYEFWLDKTLNGWFGLKFETSKLSKNMNLTMHIKWFSLWCVMFSIWIIIHNSILWTCHFIRLSFVRHFVASVCIMYWLQLWIVDVILWYGWNSNKYARHGISKTCTLYYYISRNPFHFGNIYQIKTTNWSERGDKMKKKKKEKLFNEN